MPSPYSIADQRLNVEDLFSRCPHHLLARTQRDRQKLIRVLLLRFALPYSNALSTLYTLIQLELKKGTRFLGVPMPAKGSKLQLTAQITATSIPGLPIKILTKKKGKKRKPSPRNELLKKKKETE
jgi:hypothetical protein